jgi:hypothetical protein
MLSQQVRQQQQPKQPMERKGDFSSLWVALLLTLSRRCKNKGHIRMHPHYSIPRILAFFLKHIPRRRHTVINNRLGPAAAAAAAAAAAIQIKGGEMQATVLAGLPSVAP